jgi:histidine triad (HIT) family protein
MAEDSIFTKIIKDELPSHKVYEDEFSLAFLNIAPLTPGHILVIPKEQESHIWDLNDELINHLMKTAKKVARRMQEVLKPKRVGIIVEGFGVPDHVHIHVLALNEPLEDVFSHERPEASQEELAKMAERLRIA